LDLLLPCSFTCAVIVEYPTCVSCLDAPKIHLLLLLLRDSAFARIGLPEWLVLTGGLGWWDKERQAWSICSLFLLAEWRLTREILLPKPASCLLLQHRA
jgi:hypothetical protein